MVHKLGERFFVLEEQRVRVEDFPTSGWVLDIGGGGEGVVGRLKGEQVVAIDPIPEELKESPAGPLKVVADARKMPFLDESFYAVTAFFSLMYIQAADHPTVFSETFRVLKPGGTFRLWDVAIPRQVEGKEVFVVPLRVALPAGEVRTGYGVKWPDRVLDLAYYEALAVAGGFRVVAQSEDGCTFRLELKKP